MGDPIVFIVLGAIALVSALGMFLGKNAVHSVLFLVLNFTTIAVFFLILNAPFLFVIQITVYAGAIMVLFLFVVMLLGAERLPKTTTAVGGWQVPLSLILTAGLIASFIYILISGSGGVGGTDEAAIAAGPVEVGLQLFESYVLPFEVASILLLVAMVGIVVLRTRRGEDA